MARTAGSFGSLAGRVCSEDSWAWGLALRWVGLTALGLGLCLPQSCPSPAPHPCLWFPLTLRVTHCWLICCVPNQSPSPSIPSSHQNHGRPQEYGFLKDWETGSQRRNVTCLGSHSGLRPQLVQESVSPGSYSCLPSGLWQPLYVGCFILCLLALFGCNLVPSKTKPDDHKELTSQSILFPLHLCR